MTTTTATLTDFILARIAEDEAAALAAVDDDGGSDEGFSRQYAMLIAPPSGVGLAQGGFGEAAARMIATYAVPARVLAECKAHRAIVELHVDNGFVVFGERGFCMSCIDQDNPDVQADYPCPTLRVLASIWADHEAYRAEWAL